MAKSSPLLPSTLKPGTSCRIGVITNPLSGGNRKGLGHVRAILNARGDLRHLVIRTSQEAAAALAELALHEVQVLVVNGGDGTIQAVLTELYRRPWPGPAPALALLRAGTASMIARDVGVPGAPPAALRRVLDWITDESGNAKVVERPVLKVETSPEQQPLYGMFFGAAGICQGIRFCLDRVHPAGISGQLAAGVTLGRFLIAAARGGGSLIKPVPAKVTLDKGPTEEREYFLILMSTLERLFLGLRPFWSRETAPLHFTALDARPKHLLRALLPVLRGTQGRCNLPEHGYFSRKVKEAHLTLGGGFTLDGELYYSDASSTEVIVTEGGKASFLIV